MNTDPLILILEDERSQILTLRAQLAGLGRLAEFMEPEPALEFARSHRLDAAIVDIRMPRSSMDGLEFLRALRQFDKDLAIIIRTGSESDRIADGAIEMRAIKRAVKSKTTLAELRQSTQEAVRETRERRETVRRARDTEETKARLVEALGAYDLRLAAADVHHGLVHSLRNQLTALSALAAVIEKDTGGRADPGAKANARRSAELVGGMIDSVNAFLDGPFGEGSTDSRAAVNVCLAALRQFFRGVERWSAEGKKLVLRDLLSDTRVDCAPLELVNGLRHLVEYFLVRAPPNSEVNLVASILHPSGPLAERMAGAGCVLNREAVRRDRPYVLIRASGPLPEASIDQIRDAFTFGPQGGRTGNLNVLSEVLSAAKGAALINGPLNGQFSVEAILPITL